MFKYSDEETAKSATQDGKVKPVTITSRWRKLMSLQRKIARRKNKALVGTDVEVLVEGPSEEHELVMAGRHQGQAPEIDGQVYLGGAEVLAGQIWRARVTQASDYDLVADVIDEENGPLAGPLAKPKKKRVSLKVVGASA